MVLFSGSSKYLAWVIPISRTKPLVSQNLHEWEHFRSIFKSMQPEWHIISLRWSLTVYKTTKICSIYRRPVLIRLKLMHSSFKIGQFINDSISVKNALNVKIFPFFISIHQCIFLDPSKLWPINNTQFA